MPNLLFATKTTKMMYSPVSPLYGAYCDSLFDYWYIHFIIIIVTGFIANETKYLNIFVFSVFMFIFIMEVIHYIILLFLYIIH